MLTPQQYEIRRNELVSLLDEAASLDIPEKYSSELKATAKKCKEDQFEIALVGEFQGGKSTTFDALCDGRDISPRGLGGGGLKTSAAVITVQNISDNETKEDLVEWAEISYKKPRAISLGLFDCLRDDLLNSTSFRALAGKGKSDEIFFREMTTDTGFAELVDLQDSDQRDCIKHVLRDKWTEWNKNRSRVSREDLDLLRIATLQLRYFDTQEYRDLTARKVLPILDFQKLVVFPLDWYERWAKGYDSAFTFEESAFVFIERVLVRLHSRNLERLGCRITDCPGLFASAYDTRLAQATIHNADGIWYLVNGEKTIGEQDLKILQAINALGELEGKTNATFNIKNGSHEEKLRLIYPETKTILKDEGLQVDLFPYNARLAFLATQGELLLNHPDRFSESDRANMVIDARTKDPAADPHAMWIKMVRGKLATITDLESLQGVDELNSENVATVRKESLFDDILDKVERGVIAKKSRSILVDKGSARAAKALARYEGDLKSVEDAAAAKEAEWRQKVADAQCQLLEFIARATQAIERSTLQCDRTAMSHRLAMELVQKAICGSFVDDLTDVVVAVIRAKSAKYYSNSRKLKDAIVSELNPLVGDLLRAAIVRAVESWKNPRNSHALSELLRRTQYLCDDIHELWEARKLDAVDIFSGYRPPEVKVADVVDRCLRITNDLFLRPGMSDMVDKLHRGVFTVIYDFTLGLIVSLVGGLLKWIFGIISEDAVLGYRQRIRDELERMLNSMSFLEEAAKPMVKGFLDSQSGIIENFTKSLAKLEDDFHESRCKQPEEMFSKSAAERKEIAERNRILRTERIQPLRERIEAFEAQVSRELD